ncbi:hypothetical protein [Salinifilum ghardaiensis]
MTSPLTSTLEDLIQLLQPPGKDEQRQHRPPWNWSLLTPAEQDALAGLIDDWVATYNHALATARAEIVPACWRQHPGLAIDLAVQVWLYYANHRSSNATPGFAAEYYGRHLPGFRGRVASYLGESASDCREGRHPHDWRADLEATAHGSTAPDPATAEESIRHLGELHAGFDTGTPDPW